MLHWARGPFDHYNTTTTTAQQKFEFIRNISEVKEILPTATTTIFDEIHRQLEVEEVDNLLPTISKYYFDGRGKTVRPKLTEILSEAVNSHLRLYKELK